ncbi:MAG: tetratricopeptide repeat protein [Gemmatimonadetes bacterium]|nr:tetratricopeptide repeat protein [Gemmatimonadota bacterium]
MSSRGLASRAVLLLGPVLWLAACAPGDESERTAAAPAQAVAAAGGGGGTAPPDAEGDALPPGRRPVAVPEAYRDQLSNLWSTLEQHPHDTGALLRMGRLMQDVGEPAEAAGFYERYLQLLPESQPVWLRLANTYGAASDWNRAADASFRMLERFPNDAAAMYSLGAALANQGRYDDARGWWEKVLLADDPVLMGRALRALEQLSEY